MYNWFNRHLRLGQTEPVVEKPFVPIPPTQLSVFNAEHPRPKDAVGAEALRRYLAESSDAQLVQLKDRRSGYLEMGRTAVRVMMNDRLPASGEVEAQTESDGQSPRTEHGFGLSKLLLSRKGLQEQIPSLLVTPAKDFHEIVVWIHPAGKASLFQDAKLTGAARKILEENAAILAPDVFLTGEFTGAKSSPVNSKYAGYTFGYNRPILANRVHDILTAVAFARGMKNVKRVSLAGFEKAGPWVLTALPLCMQTVDKSAVDLNGFRFERIVNPGDEMMLPGALKYGDVGFFLRMASGRHVLVHNDPANGIAKLTADEVADRLLR